MSSMRGFFLFLFIHFFVFVIANTKLHITSEGFWFCRYCDCMLMLKLFIVIFVIRHYPINLWFDLKGNFSIKTRNKLWMKFLIESLSIGVCECVYVLWQDGPTECCPYIAENTVHEEWSILKWIVFLLGRSWHPRLYLRMCSLKNSLQTFSQTQWKGVSYCCR